MGGFFGVISQKECKYDVFFGTDYHSHLGTRRGGMAFYDRGRGFQRQIHGIENTPFRTKFENDLMKFRALPASAVFPTPIPSRCWCDPISVCSPLPPWA